MSSTDFQPTLLLICGARRFEQRDFDRLGIRYYLTQGIKIVVVEVDLPSTQSDLSEDDLRSITIQSITGVSELRACVYRYRNPGLRVVCYFLGDFRSAAFWSELSDIDLDLSAITLGALPGILNPRPGFVGTVLDRIGRVKRKYLNRKIPALDHWFVSGTESVKTYQQFVRTDQNTRIVFVHNFDYDQYLIRNPTLTDDIVLFVDQNLPFHPDHERVMRDPPCEPQSYYSRLHVLLERVGHEMGCVTKVALHPTADPDVVTRYLPRCYLSDEDTFDLVSRARIVFGHCSTALGMAVIMRKPVRILIDTEISQSYLNRTIHTYAKSLGQTPVDIEASANDLGLLSLNEPVSRARYDSWIDKYITIHPHMENQSTNSWNQIHQTLFGATDESNTKY